MVGRAHTRATTYVVVVVLSRLVPRWESMYVRKWAECGVLPEADPLCHYSVQLGKMGGRGGVEPCGSQAACSGRVC